MRQQDFACPVDESFNKTLLDFISMPCSPAT